MKKRITMMIVGVGLILVASQARAESWALSVGVGGACGGLSFRYISGTPVCVAPPAVRVPPVVKCPPRVVHRVPRVVQRAPKMRRHAPRRVEVVRRPVTRVYVVPTYIAAPHQPLIVAHYR